MELILLKYLRRVPMTENEKERTLGRIRKTKSAQIREKIIIAYAPLVKMVARQFEHVSWI